jgi:hypothetical protein
MKLEEYIENIKLEITGGVLELEIPDETLAKVVKNALREVQRFIDSTQLMTVPFASCIDLNGSPISSVTKLYRTSGYTGDQAGGFSTIADPTYAQMWMTFTNAGTMYNLNDYILNYASYNTLLQIKNTVSTDLSFKYDKSENKLYINSAYDVPTMITIEYVPKYDDVDEIKSDYWIDILQRLSIAMTKQILGRIRTRYKVNSSQWTQDGDQMLAEGTEELNKIRELLTTNSQVIYPID